jgi:hypothetical protein
MRLIFSLNKNQFRSIQRRKFHFESKADEIPPGDGSIGSAVVVVSEPVVARRLQSFEREAV